MEASEQQSNHQQFKFGNSCLLFFYDQNPVNHNAPCTTVKQFSRRSNLVSECQPRRKQQNGKQNNLVKHAPSANTKPSTCSGNRVKNLQSTVTCAGTTARSDRKTNKSNAQKQQLLASKVTIAENLKQHKQDREQQQMHQEIVQRMVTLSGEQARELFGTHHTLYQLHIDYLVNGGKRTQQTGVNQATLQQLIIPSPKQYNQCVLGGAHRAAIVDQFHCKPNTDNYDKLVRDNFNQRKYLDQYFCIESLQTPGSNQTIYISPTPGLTIFPESTHKLEQRASDLPIINFMKYLYQSDDRYFKRLLEPPVSNVFSMWLFYQGSFQSVIIDGYFPTHIGSYAQEFNQNLWIVIFIKCVCKLFNTLDIRVLEKMSPSQIYQLLTGLQLKKIKIKQPIQLSDKLNDFFRTIKKKNKTLFYCSSGIYKEISQNQWKLLSQQFSLKKVTTTELYLLPPLIDYFISSLAVYRKAVTKFEIECSSQCSLSFVAPRSEAAKHLRVYIYKQNEGKLSLVYELTPSEVNWTKLKPGNYKLFYQDTLKVMEHFFEETSRNQGKSRDTQQETYIVTLMTSCDIKLSKQEMLFKSEDTIQDSLHYYSVS